MKSVIETIRTERRRRYSEAEKTALLAEVDRGGSTVAQLARRHGMAKSLLYNWRSHRCARASVASEPIQFISYGEVTAPDRRAYAVDVVNELTIFGIICRLTAGHAMSQISGGRTGCFRVDFGGKRPGRFRILLAVFCHSFSDAKGQNS